MRKVEHRLRLDLLRGGNQGYIRVKRGENGARWLAIALYMHSVPYMADAGTTAVFRAIKPDNTQLFNSATITDNVVTVGLTTQTVAALGTVRCELSIYGMNNELLYSPQFDVIVEDYIYSDTAIESTDEYTGLTGALSTVNNIVSTEAARVAAENQRVANENARVSAEAARESAETARAAAENARVSAETERASAETARASAESSRASSENIRNQAEEQRVSSETQRDTAETARSTAESGRVSAETARAEAEESRATLYAEWNGLTVEAQDGDAADAELNDVSGHKNILFTLPRGKGFTVLGQFMTLEALQSAVTTPKGGDAYGVGSTAPYDIYIWDKVENKWKNHGKLQGPQGNSGAAAGFGTPAASASKLAAGAQTTVAVTASGPDTAKVFTFEFGIPQGERGERGLQGLQGEKGDTGAYFTPAVSAEGLLTWTNNGGLTNPASANIKGAQGPQGETGPNEVTSSTATNLTGLLKGNGTSVVAATAGTDYATPDDAKAFVVTFTENTGDWKGTYTPDKTLAEIYAAYNANKNIIGRFASGNPNVMTLMTVYDASNIQMGYIHAGGVIKFESGSNNVWVSSDYQFESPAWVIESLPESGYPLYEDTIHNASSPVGTYVFTPPEFGWAHGTFTTGTAPNITFTGKIVGKLPTFEASKQYEFDVYNGAWIVQEVVTQ